MYFTLDKKGIIKAANSVGAEYLGYTVRELTEQSVLNVFYPEDRKKLSRTSEEMPEQPEPGTHLGDSQSQKRRQSNLGPG